MTAVVRELRPLRDATEAELHDEPDAVLEALGSGEIRATVTTRVMARYVLQLRDRGLVMRGRFGETPAGVTGDERGGAA